MKGISPLKSVSLLTYRKPTRLSFSRNLYSKFEFSSLKTINSTLYKKSPQSFDFKKSFCSTGSYLAVSSKITDKIKRENGIIRGVKVLSHKAYALFTWSGSLVLISVGALASFVIFYNLAEDMFSKNSPLLNYEASFNLVKENSKIIRLFGADMTAHSDPRTTRRHPRKPSYNIHWDRDGRRHLIMVYYLEGDTEHDMQGRVTLHMIDKSSTPQTSEADAVWKYKNLAVETFGRFSRKITIQGDESGFGGTW